MVLRRHWPPNGGGAFDKSCFVIEGIQVEVVRKHIKNVHLRVYPPDGHVRMSAPKNIPAAVLNQILEERVSWIRSQRTKVIKSEVKFETGEQHQFSGESFVLDVLPTKGRIGVKLCGPGTMQLLVRSGMDVAAKSKLMENWYRASLIRRASPLIGKWQEILGVGISEWRVKKMTTRWGSCNVTARRIWLSLELAKKSDAHLEYVVVHELAHLIERGHGARFVAVMDRALPNWKTLRKELNDRI